MYDIIGDIHGCADALNDLLLRLGYVRTSGAYKHAERKAIFLGDFVDKGPQVKEVLQIVIPMVEDGNAYAVVGNHEFNLVSYFSQDQFGQPLRPHTRKNRRQIETTLVSFENDEKALFDSLDWITSLPLFIETNEFRIVHAAWIDDHINYLKKHYPENNLSELLVKNAANPSNHEFVVIDAILKGIEIELPPGRFFEDNAGEIRTAVRVKWWENPNNKTLKEICVRNPNIASNLKIPAEYLDANYSYATDNKPLFLGHYCLESKPSLFASNICCVDYCVYKRGKITAYRWNGESILNENQLIR